MCFYSHNSNDAGNVTEPCGTHEVAVEDGRGGVSVFFIDRLTPEESAPEGNRQ